ncbi:MAG TPA: extracellular solute-binding protein [Dermatophilaceae bacterium]|nr:extracellular solute-binding protein [Dermatophilaceae bacterium]
MVRGLNRRQFLSVTGAAGVGLALSACGGSGTPVADTGPALAPGAGYTGPPVTIQYWHGFTGGDGPAMRQLVDDFNASQDLITVEQNTVQWAQYYQRVIAAVHAGKGPDVGAMHLEQLATQAARQTLNPLDDVVGELGLTASEYPQQLIEGGVYNGVRYGVPLDVHCLADYSNSALLQKGDVASAPTTGTQFQGTLEAIQAAGAEAPFWMPNRWPAHLMFLSLLWQFGGEPYAADGSKATFASDAGVQALTWMRQQVEAGFSPDNVAIDTQYTAFKNGQVAFTWDGIWQINDLQTTVPDLKWGITPIPRIGDQNAVWANSHNLVIFKSRTPDDDRLQAGKVFIRYLTEQSAAWSKAGMIPARAAARKEPDFTGSPQAALEPAIPWMRFLPAIPGVPDVQAQTLEIAVSDAVLGRQKPADALKGAASKADQLMQVNLRKFEGE